MEINYYRNPNSQGYDQSWQSCQFTSDTDLSIFRSEPLVTINGQTYLRQHHITYLTGRETCRAHHFAKHLAIQLLQQEKQQQQLKPRQEHRQQPRGQEGMHDWRSRQVPFQ